MYTKPIMVWPHAICRPWSSIPFSHSSINYIYFSQTHHAAPGILAFLPSLLSIGMSFQTPRLTLLPSSKDWFICPFHRKSSFIPSLTGGIGGHSSSPLSEFRFLPWLYHEQSTLTHTLMMRLALNLALAHNTDAPMMMCRFRVPLSKRLTSPWGEHMSLPQKEHKKFMEQNFSRELTWPSPALISSPSEDSQALG